jgi:xanthine dehydrogenase accessory factor
MRERAPVLVRGIGDVGSAVAVALLRAGYAVALHDEPEPTTPRRGMAFVDAVFDGSAGLDGIAAQRVENTAELRSGFDAATAIPVATWSFSEFLQAVPWSAIIDARMRKRATPERQRGSAPLTIGLGPNFVAGDNVDLAIGLGATGSAQSSKAARRFL